MVLFISECVEMLNKSNDSDLIRVPDLVLGTFPLILCLNFSFCCHTIFASFGFNNY